MMQAEPEFLSDLVRVTRSNNGMICPSGVGDLNVIHWNINRIRNKMDEIEECVTSFPGTLHVIAISETWLTDEDCNSTNILGYTGYHNYREDREGGGISIFIHESLMNDTPPVIVNNVVSEQLNHYFVLQIPKVQINIAVAYKRPLSNVDVFLQDLENYCLNMNKCLLMGDLNINLLVPNNFRRITSLFEEYGFALLNEVSINAITRPAASTLLDLCACNMLSFSFKFSITFNTRSDHGILAISVSKKAPENRHAFVRHKLDDRQASARIERCLTENDILDGNVLSHELETITHECSKEIRINSRYCILKPFVTREIIDAIRERDRLYSLMILYPNNTSLHDIYLGKMAFVKRELKLKRIEYENERIDQVILDPSKTWQIYKEILFNRKKSNADTTITINGVPVGSDVQSCNVINDKVCSIGAILAADIISVNGYDCSDINALYRQHALNNWSFSRVSVETVKKIIANLPNKKSTGFDKVPVSLLKKNAQVISPTLTNCLNAAIETGIYPSEWTKGRLKLIHKSGDSDLDNFRGLTLMPVISKISEEELSNQLSCYLHSIGFFDNNQFGFLKNSSCVGAASQLVEELCCNYKEKFTACTFIDLRKAFDTVDPHRLLLKMKQLGLSDAALQLMSSYLLNRETAIKIGNERSNFQRVSVGVAQGSKIGPLHFVIYINDMLMLELNGKMILYADDAVLSYACDSMTDLQESMQQDANTLCKWLATNMLTLNVKKTCYMTYGKTRRQPDMRILFENQPITRVRTFTYLGLRLDELLSFHTHVDHVKRMIAPFIALMWRNGRYIAPEKRALLYFAYVQSHLQYMLPIWGLCGLTKLIELQVMQNRCIKAILRVPRDTPTTFLYSNKILPITILAKYERLVNIRKMVFNETKHHHVFATSHQFHGRQTRNSNQLHIDNRAFVNSGNSAPITKAMIEYNNLQSNLRETGSLKDFKRQLRWRLMEDDNTFHYFSPYRIIN